MAQMNTTLGTADASALLTLVTSLGVLLCLIVSLLGIKIWWFKHRLTFDQSSTRNGAAGGAQPAVVVPRVSRSRSSKDKRLSQQVCETVVVHGVFRQRREDELEYERPNQLPPVRIRQLSQSTPSLLVLPSPKRRNENSPTPASIYSTPPTREPPRPPRSPQSATTPTLTAETTQEMFLPTTSPKAARAAPPFENMEYNTHLAEPLWQAEVGDTTHTAPPQAPKRLNRSTSSSPFGGGAVANTPTPESVRKFLKAKSTTLEPIYRPAYPERRLTGFYKPNDEEDFKNVEVEEVIETEQFGDRRPTGYIKYEEVDRESQSDLTDFHAKWQQLQLGGNERPLSNIPIDTHNVSRNYSNYEEVKTADFSWKEENMFKERRPTGYSKGEEEHTWSSGYKELENNARERQQEVETTAGHERDFETLWNTSNNDLFYNEGKQHQNKHSAGLEFEFENPEEHRPTVYPRKQDEDVWNKSNNYFDDNNSRIDEERTISTDRELEFEVFKERRPTSYTKREEADIWDTNHNDFDNSASRLLDEHIWNSERMFYQEARNFGIEEIPETKNEHKAIESKDYTDGMDIFESPRNIREETDIYVDNMRREPNKPEAETYNEKTTTRSVKFQIPNNEDTADDQEDSEWQVHRRPTGYVRDAQHLWTALEESVASNVGEAAALESEQNLWLEMEKDILQNDFASNIEQEFNKIRHSYEENEGDFLEHMTATSTSSSRRDMGFGKSIEEDWQSFEELQVESVEERTTMNRTLEIVTERGVGNQNRDYVELISGRENLKYQAEESSEFVEPNTVMEQQRYNSGVYQNQNTELYQERLGKKVVTFEEPEEEENEERFAEYKTEIQTRRPTGFVKRDLDRLKDELAETAISERRKIKPRQKVTFDFNTEEYYLPAQESEDDDEGDKEQLDVLKRVAAIEMPKPMQRITKMHYTEEEDSDENDKAMRVEHPITPPILFSTQISREDSPELMVQDSWSAIRQHRHLTEEFQQMSLAGAGENLVIKPAPRLETSRMREVGAEEASGREPPKPAFRNPLAQVTVASSSQRDELFIKPPMRERKRAQQSSGERYSFTEYSTSGTTEA